MRIALTFDTEPAPAGHAPGNDLAILDALRDADARATFFVQGEWAQLNPDLAARLVRDGHRVANHTQTHVLPGTVSPDILLDEIETSRRTMLTAAGVDSRPYFRCPQNSGAFSQDVLDSIGSAGYRQCGWDYDSFDWHDGMSAETLRETAVAGILAAGDGAVALFHSWPDATAQALPEILAALKHRGARFVTLDELDPDEIPIAAITPTDPPRAASRLGSSAAWGIAAKVATVLANLAIGVVVARTLGPVGKGDYALVQQVVGVLAVVLGLGLSTSNVYFVARREVSSRVAAANSVWLSAVMTAIALIVSLLFISGPLAPERSYSIAMALVAAALFGTSTLLSWLNSVSSGRSGLKPQSIAAIVSVTVVVGGTLVAAALGVMSPLLVIALGALGQLAGVFTLYAIEGRAIASLRPSRAALSKMLPYSLGAYAVNTTAYLHLRQDVLLIGWMLEPAAVGIYSVAVSLAEVVRYLPSVVGAAVFSRVSQAGAGRGGEVSMRVSRLTVAAVVALGVLVALVGPSLIDLLFGARFADASALLLLLLPGVVAMGAAEPAGGYLFAHGIVYWRLSVVAVIVNAALNILVIPVWGLTGAAIASSLTYGLFGIAIVIWVSRVSTSSILDWILVRREDIRWVRSRIRSSGGTR